LPIPDRDDFTFAGWFDNDQLTGSAVTAIAADDAGPKEFWAKWDPVVGAATILRITTNTFVPISAITLPRSTVYSFGVIMNIGLGSADIKWSINNLDYATVVEDTGVVTLLGRPGTVILTATDITSGATHSITIRIT